MMLNASEILDIAVRLAKSLGHYTVPPYEKRPAIEQEQRRVLQAALDRLGPAGGAADFF